MNCPNCNTVCIKNAFYCHICGSLLSNFPNGDSKVTNEQNSSLNEALKRLMPGSYVEKLLASKGQSVGERRVVTILFSDVKGSTEMSENLDPEEVFGIMNKAFGVLIEPIMKYEGTLARLMGDAILAFFGAPIAHEDDPQRACRAALEIISGANKFSESLSKEKGIKGFSVRVGINTGLVVVAEVGADFRVEYTAMGDAVNVASRMESAAEPGTILITEDTRKQLCDEFEIQSMGAIKVKGRKNSVDSFRVLSEKTSIHTGIYNINYSPLVGRDNEIKQFLKIFGGIKKTSKGKIISVIGECGVGKSRLASEIRNLTAKDMEWVEIRSVAYQHNNSYWLIKNLLKNHLGQESSQSLNLQNALQQKIKSVQRKSSGIYSVLSSLLDLHKEDFLPFKYEINDAESLKGQIHYSVMEYFKSQITNKPIVLLLEDLQWCDPASLDLITELYSLTTKGPFIVINTFRKEESCIWDIHLRALQSYKTNYLPVVLNSLNESDSRILLRSISENLSLSAGMEDEILRRTGGNPFFIEQILKAYTERFNHKNNKHTLTKETDPESEIPNLLQSVIMSRLDYLSHTDKMILQTASVIGRSFHIKLLLRILSDTVSEKEVNESLRRLIKREFILPQKSIEDLQDSGQFLFTQSLIQEVAYNSLLISSREKTHLAAGEAIEELYPEEAEELASTLAEHFEKGRQYKRAVHYYSIAAEIAKNIFANKEAILFYNKIINLTKLYSANKSLKTAVYESLGDINLNISDYSKAIAEYEKALESAENSNAKGIIYQKCGQVYEKWGHYEESIKFYDLSLETGEINNSYTAQTFMGKAMVYYRKGDIKQAAFFNKQALNLIKGNINTFQLSECYNIQGIINAKEGDFIKCAEYLHKALDIRLKLSNMSGLAASFNNLGFLYQSLGETAKAIEYYTKSLEYCEKTGNMHGLAKIYDNLSQIYILCGERDKAISYNLLAMEILGKLTLKAEEVNQHLWLQSGVW